MKQGVLAPISRTRISGHEQSKQGEKERLDPKTLAAAREIRRRR
jgi:hypothetical protein